MTTRPQPILIEGFSPEELLRLPVRELESYVCTGEPLVMRVGSAEVLGEFRMAGGCLVVELAQIDGGGEGVLSTLWLLARRLASARGMSRVEWVVHAVACARPNLKLRRVLERRGFTLQTQPGGRVAYHLIDQLRDSEPQDAGR